MRHFMRSGALVFAMSLLAACGGGGDNDASLTSGTGGGSTNTDGDTNTGETGTERTVRFGSFSGGAFTAGQIATNLTSLEASQSATLTVNFIDQDNTLVTDAADVLFNSPCISSGLAEVSPAIVSNSTGSMSTSYTARGCDGADVITAQTSLDGTTYSATVTITSTPAPLGTISFISATPQLIGIKGSGAIQEQSEVSFKVTNTSGGPVPNQEVTFSLDNTTGGITLSTDSDTSNSEGIVSTTVSSGTVATSVRVTAVADDGTTVSEARSSALAITTGLADQDSFSLSATKLNIEGWEYDGITTILTIRAADRFNNPAPDGTAVTFQAEGASVQGSCETSGGACSVTLTSQNPRPADGRITVLATAVGEESFVDSNPSNGRFDGTANESFDDLGEAFRDDNENGTRDSNEYYVDFNNNQLFDVPSTTFEGVLCAADCNIDGKTTVNIREQIVIVLSGSSLFTDVNPAVINLDTGPFTVIVYVEDERGQVPPAETTISVETDQGSISGSANETMLSTNDPGPAAFSFIVNPGSETGTGTFTATVTTPNGIISRATASVVQTLVP